MRRNLDRAPPRAPIEGLVRGMDPLYYLWTISLSTVHIAFFYYSFLFWEIKVSTETLGTCSAGWPAHAGPIDRQSQCEPLDQRKKRDLRRYAVNKPICGNKRELGESLNLRDDLPAGHFTRAYDRAYARSMAYRPALCSVRYQTRPTEGMLVVPNSVHQHSGGLWCA